MATHVIDPTTFGDQLTLQETQLIANWMSVTPGYFADMSCERDRVFGLNTICSDSCRKLGECDCAIMLQPCVRNVMWKYLHMVQQEVETKLGWTLTPRYVREEFIYHRTNRYATKFGGLVTGCVGMEVVDPGLAEVAYHYALITNITSTDNGADKTEVRLPRDIVDNPTKIMFFRSDNGSGVSPSGAVSYRIDGTDWVVVFEQGSLPPGVDVDAVHCEFGYVDVTYANDGDCAWELVYPNSIQKIPIWKIETLSDEVTTRYWLRHRDMINPAFTLATIDLEMGEFWKLHQTVDFMQFCAVQRLATIYCDSERCTCNESVCQFAEIPACCRVINSELGILEVTPVSYITDETQGTPVYDTDGETILYVTDADGNILFEAYDYCDAPCYHPIKVVAYYKTDPKAAGYDDEAAIQRIRRAIAAKVAAEVPFIDCGCTEYEFGFFKEMRQDMSSSKTNAIGDLIMLYEYGNLYGQKEFATIMGTVQVKTRPTVIRRPSIGDRYV